MAEKFLIECNAYDYRNQRMTEDNLASAIETAEEVLRDIESCDGEGADWVVTISLLVPVREVTMVSEPTFTAAEVPFSLSTIAGCMK